MIRSNASGTMYIFTSVVAFVVFIAARRTFFIDLICRDCGALNNTLKQCRRGLKPFFVQEMSSTFEATWWLLYGRSCKDIEMECRSTTGLPAFFGHGSHEKVPAAGQLFHPSDVQIFAKNFYGISTKIYTKIYTKMCCRNSLLSFTTKRALQCQSWGVSYRDRYRYRYR